MTIAPMEEKDHVQVVSISDDERRKGKYSPSTLQKALEAMHQDGLVVLKDVIDSGHIATINERMCVDADKKRVDPSQTFNHGVKCRSLDFHPLGRRICTRYSTSLDFVEHELKTTLRIANFLQRPPVTESSYLFEGVYFNPFLLQLANASVSPTTKRIVVSCIYLCSGSHSRKNNTDTWGTHRYGTG